MIVPAAGVAKAYAAGKVAGIAGPALDTATAPERGSFAGFVETAVKSAIKTVRTGEEMSAAGLQGKASAQEVVQAVMSAEMTVQAVVTVRDKLVSAYLDIMRMGI
ncbi:flagellar hook-basal body complex protein FliE [Rhodospirillum centenum]|uniref:Flagellar hook-basal body complex protein FliE n=1 Tax=Rhodospirillum centenum (strain ATCC 51521 / SW) TaxID=414684 RepID=B6IQA8_RHOCS|nr:flagellar hook-basal body complex protein FliE [Rhodospirillum centenum]ACI97644.1 flagellar hook-basal body complex protein FliE, putative [Rhodospirillum centenum SW]